jgi:hypothetical protein
LIELPIHAQSVQSALERSRYSEAEKESIITFFDLAESAGIPHELLLPKLEEGIAKGIPAQRVLEALRRESENLQRTRSMLANSGGEQLLADPASWARTANLLAMGISEAQIQRLVALCGRHTEGYRPATYLYVAVAEWGLEEETAFELIAALLSSSIPPESYMGVMDLLAGGRRRRISPEELVQRIIQHLEHSKTTKELEKWIY